VIVTSRRIRKRRAIRSSEKRKGRGLGTRFETPEEIGGTSLALFQPADTSTKSRSRSFLRQAVVQLIAVIENSRGGSFVRDITSSPAVGRGQLAFEITAIRLSTASGEVSVVLCVWSSNDLGSVPVFRRVVRVKERDGGGNEFVFRKEEGVIAPYNMGRGGSGGKGYGNSVVITEGIGSNPSREGERKVARVSEYMV
jgi:hypothetical protein